MRIGKKWNRLMNIERLEDRTNPDATFGWEAAGAGLYFQVDGDTSGQLIADSVSVMNDPVHGTINVFVSTLSADDLVPLDYYFSITGGEIALAQGIYGKPFKGLKVNTYDGNDTVGALGLPWAMQIDGGAGSDNLSGGSVADIINGGTGGLTANDTIVGSSGSDTIIGGDGNDNINAGSGNDNVNAGTGNDTVVAGSGNDTVDAGPGNDNVDGGTGNDAITAGDGDDTVNAGAGNDTVTGGLGNDILNGDADNDNLSGNEGNDTITGGAGADSLFGNDGNDIVNVDTSDVAFNGGAGTDTMNLTVTGTGILGPIIDHQTDGFEVYNLAPAAVVTFAPSIADFSNPQPNYGGIGLNLGDTLSFMNAPVGQTIDMNSLPFGLAGNGILSVIGSAFNDFITGTAGNDVIDGAAGDDVLSGGAGNDTMSGGAGNDVVLGEAGNDVLSGGAGNDFVAGGVGDDSLVIEWAGGALNANDTFLGQDGFDTFVFQGVPDADGNPGNGIQPSAANLATIYAYMSAQNASAKMDWNLGNTGPDNTTLVFIP